MSFQDRYHREGHYTVAASGEARSAGSRASTCSTAAGAHLPAAVRRGVVELYRAFKANDKTRTRRGLRDVGFPKLTPGTTAAMTGRARFMCGPILHDRVRTAADGVKPSEYETAGDRAGACER